MKNRIILFGICTLLLMAVPVIPAMAVRETETDTSGIPEIVEFTMELTETEAPAQEDPAFYPVLDTETGEVMEVSVRDYVIGAVCAEMPASFAEEALKAQAVAAHTYACRMAIIAQNMEDPSLKGAYFSNDSTKYQAFLTPEEIRAAYGDSYDTYYPKVAAAVDAVLDEVLLYEGMPIIAAFHAMSGGRTESAETVWGMETPYLVPVDSPSDTDAPQYEQTVAFTSEEVREILANARENLLLHGEPETWFSGAECTESGTVTQIQAGSGIFTGQEIRSLFSLRSAVFTVAYADGEFTFTTRGYGHHVGMSQYGADALARDGKNYREILAHYYPNAEIGAWDET